MATYYIPTDVVGGTILVNEGDIFIFESDAITDVKFEAASGTATSFAIEFNSSNSTAFRVEIKEDLSAGITIADDVVLDNLDIKAGSSDSTDVTIGDNVTLDQFEGSDNGTDTIEIGDNFTTNNDFNTGAGDDSISIGENATAPKIDTGDDRDTVITRDPDVTIENAEIILKPDGVVDGTAGNDKMGAGYTDTQTDAIDGADGDDDTIVGYYGNDKINGGAGNDAIYGDYGSAYVAPPAAKPGAEELDFVIDDIDVSSGTVDIPVEKFSTDVSLANDLAIIDTSSVPITEVIVRIFGGNDGEEDVIRFDLTTFDDDFLITIEDEDAGDKVFLIGVEQETDNGDGTFTYTYVGSDGLPHSVTVDPDTATIETYQALLDASVSSDIIDGGAGDDTIDGGFGDDQLTGGIGADTISGGLGDDTLSGGDDADILIGGAGDDTLTGGDGADILAGDDAAVPATPDRVVFKWSAIPDPDNGGQIDDFDEIVSGSQEVGNTTVDFSITGNAGQYETTTLYTSGIDAGTGSVDANSALGLDGNDGVLTLDFSNDTENVQFRINDFESNLETIQISAYDADNNLITFLVTQGSGISGTDTDAVAGNDTFESSLVDTDDDSPDGSILVDIPGPVARIEIDFSQTGGSLTLTDIYFDDPTLAGGNTGDDDIDGGAGDDIIIASRGTDAIDGGTGTDTYDASSSGSLEGDTLSVTIDQSGDGTVGKTSDATTDTVTSVENFIADEVDGQVDTITFTGDVDRNLVSGLSDGAVGLFTPSNGGDPMSFGGTGEPTVNELLSGTYDPGTGVVSPKGTYQITAGEEDGAQIGNIAFSKFEQATFSTVCYGVGSLIDTPLGPRPVEELRPGDLVDTLDAGPLPVKWVRSAPQPLENEPEDNRPVLIKAGALGKGLPAQDLIVSSQHRILVGGRDQLDGTFPKECFAPAKALTNLTNVRFMRGKSEVTWVHFALEAHHVVRANGLYAESLFLGKMVVQGLGLSERRDVEKIFGRAPIDGTALNGPPARPFLTVREVRRHINGTKNPAPINRRCGSMKKAAVA